MVVCLIFFWVIIYGSESANGDVTITIRLQNSKNDVGSNFMDSKTNMGIPWA
jgi:hypothetical protein